MRRRITAFVAAIGLAAALSTTAPPVHASHLNSCTLVSINDDGTSGDVLFEPFTLTNKQLRLIQAVPPGTTITYNGYTIVKTGENTFAVTDPSDPSGEPTDVTLVCI